MAKPIPEMPSSVFVALVGRPNVGKSSLTNYLVGEKVAIVTKKPQTTRSRITGVITKGPVQYVLMDTPGIHAARNKLDARMTQTAAASLKDVDVTMMLFEPAGEFTDAELTMVKALQKGGLPSPLSTRWICSTALLRWRPAKSSWRNLAALTILSRSRLRTALAVMSCLPCSSRTATKARTTLTTMPSPICRKRNWWQSWCARKHCSSCGRRSLTALPLWSSALRSALTRTSSTLMWTSTANARATRA